jgi:hypothetical protein
VKVSCPLGDCSGELHVISVDGGLRHIKHYLIPDLIKQGWRRVDNPKRSYYPEYDKTSSSYKNEEFETLDSDILPVTIL